MVCEVRDKNDKSVRLERLGWALRFSAASTREFPTPTNPDFPLTLKIKRTISLPSNKKVISYFYCSDTTSFSSFYTKPDYRIELDGYFPFFIKLKYYRGYLFKMDSLFYYKSNIF